MNYLNVLIAVITAIVTSTPLSQRKIVKITVPGAEPKERIMNNNDNKLIIKKLIYILPWLRLHADSEAFQNIVPHETSHKSL